MGCSVVLINTKQAWEKSHGAASVGSLEKLFLLLGVTYRLYIDLWQSTPTRTVLVVKPEHVLKCLF